MDIDARLAHLCDVLSPLLLVSDWSELEELFSAVVVSCNLSTESKRFSYVPPLPPMPP